ncbi:hypothetical protein TSUD_184280 [Trifolium subterraneum]|uniref:Uncharacterized protein n=1 Tax=Trifolium subterraneum TaxID=3900 RepID=A0A2Z6PHD1_TRISU|nr:hypothetical protein TSUD_184280 [Trifolium subterraneum]
MQFLSLTRHSTFWESLRLSQGPLTENQSALNTSDIPKIVIKDDFSSEAHKVEVSNFDCGTFPNYQHDTVMIKRTFGESSVSKKKELVNIGNQMDSDDLLCKSETSMFDVVDKNTSVISEGNSDNRASFSSFNTVVSSKSCILGETTQVCENNKSHKLGHHKSFGQDISVIDQGSEKAPFDSSTIHCDVDQSHLSDKGVCSSSLGAGSMETPTVSVDVTPPVSISGHHVLKRMTCVGSASVDEKEDFEDKKFEEAGSSLPVGSSELEVDPCPVARTENKNNSDNTRQILCETNNSCLDNLDTTATEKIGEPQETQTGKVDHECTKEAIVAAVLYESIEKHVDEVNATANLNPPVFELLNKDATNTSSSDHDHKGNDVSKDMDATNTPSSDHDHKGNDVSKDGRSLAPEVDLVANLSEKDVTDLTQIGANADGGRNFSEKTWSPSLERQRGHKSHPINPETPRKARSGTRTPDLAIKRSELQGKCIPSPLGLASSKGTSTIVNPFIPLSSPLWSYQLPHVTPCNLVPMQEILLSSIHKHLLHCIHPNQTPLLRNFLGHNTSRMSQTPLRGPWIASTTALDNSSYNSDHLLQKSSSIKGTSLPSSSSTKNVPPGLPASSVGLESVFLPTTPLFNTNNVTVSHARHSSDLKSKKRKKVTIESEDLGQKAMYFQSHPVSTLVVSSHVSTPIATATPVMNVPITTVEKSFESVSPLSLVDRLKTG